MGWKSVPAHDGYCNHKEEWDSLNARYANGNPYFDSRFIGPLIDCFATETDQLWLHYSDEDVDGACILSNKHVGKVMLFVPSQVQIAPLFVRDDEMLLSLVRAISPINLAMDVPCQDPFFTPIKSATTVPLDRKDHAHTICVSVEGTFDEFWRSRSKNLRSSVARRRKKVEKEGIEISFVHRTSVDEMIDAIGRFGELESQSWKGEAGTAVHASNTQGRFYASVMELFAQDSQASVYELYFDKELVAIEFGIVSNSMVVLLKTTFDSKWAKYSPGRLLLYELLQEEFRLGRTPRVEFYTSADGNELSWASEGRWVFNATIFRNRVIRAAHVFCSRLKNSMFPPSVE